MSSVVTRICSNTIQVTCPAEDSNNEVADADPRRNNLDCMSKNSVGICETEKESSRHEQTKESTAHAKSQVSGRLTDACASKKGQASGQNTIEGDDRSLVSSESAEIVVKNSLQGSGHDGSNGLRRRKARKIRLLTDLLCEENGVGNADAPKKTADLPSGVIIPDASAAVDKPPVSPRRVSIEGSVRRSLLPNKKRKIVQDDEWSTPDTNAYSRVSKEARTSKKAVDITKINGADPCDVVKDKMVLQSSIKSNSSKIRSENSAGKGKKIVNTESAVPSSELVAGVKDKTSTKNKFSKARGDNSITGKKKDKSILVADEHLSLAPPSSENLATVIAGDACKANTTDHAVPKSLKNRHASKEIDLFPLPSKKIEEISTAGTRQLKSGEVGDLQSHQLPTNMEMLGEDLLAGEVEARIPSWPVKGATNPLKDLSNERELNLSLDIHPAAHKSERPFNRVKDRQGSFLDGYAGTSKDRVMSENEHLARLSSIHTSPMLSHCGGVQSDNSRKEPIIGLPFLRGIQNYNSPTDMGGFLVQKKDFGNTSSHENPTGIRENVAAAKIKDVDQRAVKVSEQGSSDDIPMEVVELMAKNQYERCLPDAQAESYRSEAASRSSRVQTMDFGNGYRQLNMRPYYQEAYNEKLQTHDGRNGIIQWGENVRLTKQKSVPKFPQADQNRFFIYQPEQSRSNGSHGEFLRRQKPSSMMQNSASSSRGEIGDQNLRWFGDVSMNRQPQTSSHPTGPWNASQNIPQQNNNAHHLWRPSVPSHHLPFSFNFPQKNASSSTRMDGLLPSSSSIPISRDSDLNYPTRNVGRLQRQSNGLDCEMPSRVRLENQLTGRHRNAVQHNQNPTGNLDPHSDSSLTAVQLLSLMHAKREENHDGEPKLPRRPSNSLEQHSGSYKENGETTTLPYGYVGKNQFTRGVHTPPTIGSSSTSFQLDRGFNKAINFTSQAPQATGSSFKITSGPGPVKPTQNMLLGSSDSYRIPFQIPTSRPSKASTSGPSDQSLKRKAEVLICKTNMNPADFTYPDPNNPFMIGAEDLKFLDGGRVKAKRQKQKEVVGSSGGGASGLNPQP
ncbi:Protein EMBRYONIC FLOWER 1 [Linum grandiflorum]